jgi:ADP-dependent NAD(P)H-hydrate dehydratase / NAD(P)H-hydrate epimerase
MKLVTVAEMIAIEKEADAQGLTYDQMMENAGKGLADVIVENYPNLKENGILALVGSGNNGGDALVALTYLAQQGWKTTAFIVRPRKSEDYLINRLVKVGGKIEIFNDEKDYSRLKDILSKHAILLDGILGTGIQLPLRGEISEILINVNDWIKQMKNPLKVVAVDCPSGVDCESGAAAAECISADLTVTMAAVKTGLLKFPAYNLIGEMWVVDIGLEDESLHLPTWNSVRRNLADQEMVKTYLPSRSFDAHKGTFGTAILVAGSLNYTGAALLAGEAAFRVGAGLITMAVPEPLHAALSGQFPESTWLLLPSESGVIAESAADVILNNLARATAIMLGPGFGTKEPTEKFLKKLFDVDQGIIRKEDAIPSLIIDADGLKLLASINNWPQLVPPNSVLTPHPGEMSVLTGLSVAEIQANRLEIAEKFARLWNMVLVLKGANTVVASPAGNTTVIPIATPALARAGTGDVLSGLIVGLLAQGLEPYYAAVAGCWIHAQAGLVAAESLGSTASVLARDIISAIIHVMADLDASDDCY